MKDLVKSRAEEQFAATQKKDNQARKERDNVSQERAEHVESLQVLRLAKEAAAKEAAEEAAAEKAAAEKAAAEKAAAKKKSHRVCLRLTDARNDGEDCD